MNEKETEDFKTLMIFQFIRERGPLSRSELVRLTGISSPTVGKYLQKLLDRGWVAEIEGNDSKGKHRGRLLELNPHFGPSLGIEVGGSQLRWVVANLGGEVLSSGTREVGKENFTDALVSQVATISSGMEIEAIGIASTGIVEAREGISLHSPHREDMDDIPLKRFIEEQFGLPVYVDDVSRSSALAEWRLGVLRGERDFLYLFLDEGIGFAWAVDGKLYYGPCGISGEIGHFVIDENGPRCGCGNKGCFEALASAKAIVRNAQKALEVGVSSSLAGRKVTIENVVTEALRGDKLCYSLLVEAAELVGKVMAQVLNLTGVPLLILGGRLSAAGGLIIEPMRRVIKTQTLSFLGNRLEIRVATLGREGGALGAALQALLEAFNVSPAQDVAGKRFL